MYESVITGHRPAAVAAARVLVDAARAGGAAPPPAAVQLLDEPGQETAAVDADRLWCGRWPASTGPAEPSVLAPSSGAHPCGGGRRAAAE